MIHFLEEDLQDLRQRHLYRFLRNLEPGRDSVHALFEGRELLLFCGNDYLGLSRHPRVIAAAQESAGREGTGAGAARLVAGSRGIHARLEEKLAILKGKERALVFSAGYMANLGTLTALARRGDLIVMDKLCHASLIDGARLSEAELRVFPHKNYERCEELVKASAARRKIIVSDTLFSMDGDRADLAALVQIKEKHGAILVVDDAHGTGICGAQGGGIPREAGLQDRIDVITGTLSKSLGALGGFAAGSNKMMEYLINFARPFIYATALPPMVAAAALEAIAVIQEQPELLEKLLQNQKKLAERLQQLGYEADPASPIFPVLIGDEANALKIADAFLKEGLWVPAIRPPTVPKGTARLRVTVSADHDLRDIQQFMALLGRFQGGIPPVNVG